VGFLVAFLKSREQFGGLFFSQESVTPIVGFRYFDFADRVAPGF
jgi:hypothetical protein